MLNVDEIRKDFPILKKIIYLDSASTSLTPNPVINSMNDYYMNYNANTGRGAYKIAIKATNKVEETREKIAKFINSNPNEIIFTKNTTEGINLISKGFKFEKGENIIISSIEHHSNFIPWLNLEKKGIEIRIAKSNKDGIVEESSIEKLLDSKTRLVSISHISNAIGSKQKIDKIEKIVHNNKTIKNSYNDNNTYFLVDGAQSIGHIPINIKKINPDFMAFPGHKGLLGPTGTGFLYIKKDHQEKIEPQNLGGGTITNIKKKSFKLEEAPYRFEGGTKNIAGIIGLNESINYINHINIKNIEKHSINLTKKLYKSLDTMENIEVYGNEKNIIGIVSFNINNANPHDIAKILDESENICVRSGHHCAIPAIRSINSKKGTIRSSMHCYNNLEDIEKLISSIEELKNMF